MNHPFHGWPRLSHWLRNACRIDRLFSRSRPGKKKRGCDLKIEELEIRWLPTTVEFATGFYATSLTSPINVLVELNASSTATITVDYATADGNALAGTDYTAASGVLTFAPGSAIQSFNVSLMGTNTNPRDFTITLSSPSGATLGAPDTELVLLDPPTVQFPTIDFDVNEDGGYGAATVTLSAASPLSTSVNYATSDYTARAGLNYTPESGTLTFAAGQTSATFTVPVNDFALPIFDTRAYLTLSLPTAGATISGGAAYLVIQSDEGGQPNYPYPAKPLVAAGPSATLGLDPASGDLIITQAIDPNLTADCGCGSGTLIPNGKEGMGANNQVAYVEGVPAFVYTSASEEARPIISAYFPSSAGDPLPTDIKVRLTFNGATGSWITYATTGHSAGDQYLLAGQPVMPATTTGRYAYTLEMQAEYSSYPTLSLSVSGNVNLVVNGVGILGGSDPYGNGVSISGVDQLVSVTGGVLWVYGAGGSAYFSGTSGTLLNASDSGTLIKNTGGTYTYTRGGMTWSFDSSGYLTSIATPGGGQTRTYTYASGRISSIDEPDGFFYSFTYATTLGQTQLASVALLGGRTVNVAINSSNELTGITNPAGDARTFAYDPTTKRMSSDDAVALRTFTYDTIAGKIGGVNYGNGDTWGVVPALVKALQSTAVKGADATGDFLDPLGNHTTYGIDGYARAVERADPDGYSQSWGLNKLGDITKTVDARGNETDYTYAAGTDNVTGALFPDGSRVSLTYDSFNKPITITDQLGNLTTITRDGTTGSALSIANPLAESEAFTFTSDRVQTMTDALGHVTTVLYNSSGWMQTVIDPAGNRTTFGYDLAGNLSTTTTPDGAVGTVLYDADRRVIGTTAPGAGTYTSTYNGQGLLATEVDPTGHTVTSLYNAQGWRTAVVDIYGHSTTATYDAAGRQVTSIDVYGNITTYVNDTMGRVTAVVDPYGHGATTTYDADSNVISVTDIYGNETQYAYDSMNRQVAVVDPYGHTASTVYDVDGHVTASIDIYANATTYLYDAAGKQTVTIDPYSHRATVAYNAADQVQSTSDIYGNVTTNIYDSYGRQVATEDQYGHFATTTYNAAGQVGSTTDVYGNVTTSLYDSAGRPNVVIDMYGHATTTIYDALGRVSATVDVYGNATTTVYDSFGRVSATIDELGNHATTTYDAYGRVSAQIDMYGNAVTTAYDSMGRVSATVDALGNRATTIYDAYGRQSATQDALGNFTTTVYDSLGRTSASVDPLGDRATTIYDSYGRASASVDPLGNRATTLFDTQGRVSATVNALGNISTNVYDSYGRVSAVIDPLGNRATTLWDPAGRVVASENALGNFTTTVYDSYGRAAATKDALGNFTTAIFDTYGRVAAGEDALGNFTTTIYDTYGRASATVDPLGNRGTTIYDSYGRVSATENALGDFVTTIYDSFGRTAASENSLSHFTTNVFDSYGRQVATIDPLGNRTTMVLDSLGRQVNEIDADSNKTTFVYDALGRVVQEITPTAGSTTMAYDADGRLASRTDALGQVTTYAYDAVGNNTAQTWHNAGGSVVGNLTFTYDSDGRQLTAANATGAYTLAYDATGEVTNERGPFGANLTMTYDADGHRTVVDDNFGGVTTSAYDANGNLTQEETGGAGLTPARIDFTYNPDGEETGATRYSDLAGTTKVATTSLVYDAVGNVTGQVDKTGGGTNIASYTNIYDANNQITSEQLNGGTPTSYTYDADGEVTGDGVNTPTYDAEGSRTNTGYTTTTGNQLQTDGTWNYKYDAAGNETEKVNIASGVAWTYSYDDKNELVEAEKWSSDPTVYGTAYVEAKVDHKYDAWGNEAERDDYPTGTGSPVVTRYEVDGWNPALAGTTGNSRFNVLADLDGSNALQTRYVHGDKIDQLLARIDGAGNAYWTLTDRQGSVRDVLDNTGVVKDALNYDAFGNIIGETNSTYRGSYAWTGRELDVESDLQYNRARWYDPATSRWMSQDPLGFDAGDSNLYRYANNRPLLDRDPSGLFTWRMNSLGKIIAVAENGDSLRDLAKQGYDGSRLLSEYKNTNNARGEKPLTSLDDVLDVGAEFDVTFMLPQEAARAIRRQQTMQIDKSLNDGASVIGLMESYLKFNGYSFSERAFKGMTAGDIITTECYGWMFVRGIKKDGSPGRDLSNIVFGYGQCYGFVAIMFGEKLPVGVEPWNYWAEDTKTGKTRKWKDNGGTVWQAGYAPVEGLENYFMNGRKQTTTPKFGDVAIFRRQDKDKRIMTHAAIVLGRSRNGEPYLIEKINSAMIYTVLPANAWETADFGQMSFYGR